MIYKLLIQGYKEKRRSKIRSQNILIQLLLGFFFLYLIAIMVSFGYFLPQIIIKTLGPEVDPVQILNNFLLYYIGIDVVFRFVIQELPILSIKPFLVLNIKKSQIANYLLFRSFFSAFNLIPLVFFVVFSTRIKEYGYDSSYQIFWMITCLLLIQFSNFINNYIKRASTEKFRITVFTILVYSTVFGLDYFNIFSLKLYFGQLIDFIVSHPYLILLLLGGLFLIYKVNLNYLIKKLSLDNIDGETYTVNSQSIQWVENLGNIAPYVKNDLKMIWRNKRPKSLVGLSFAMLFYGLIIYSRSEYDDMNIFKVFVGVFITGIFAINFGQFIPAWDSGHYSLLMTQRTNLFTYVKSKFFIMSFSVILFFVLSTPYVYFGQKIILYHFAGAIYNIGINIMILLLLSSYNNKRIDLDKGALMNYQGMSAKQWLVVLPTFIVPSLLYWIVSRSLGENTALGTLIGLGALGILFHKKLILIVAQQLAERKHKIIEAFKEK